NARTRSRNSSCSASKMSRCMRRPPARDSRGPKVTPPAGIPARHTAAQTKQLRSQRYCEEFAIIAKWRLTPQLRRRAPMADPRARVRKIRDGLTPREWARAGGMTATIIGLHILGWGMLAAAEGGHYHITRTEIFGFGTGILAYTLGMRHAFDADHIAAIDNTTRKLVGEGKRPLSTGFFFSLGHSSVVFGL